MSSVAARITLSASLLLTLGLTIDELIVAFDQLVLFRSEIPIIASIPMGSPVVAFSARFTGVSPASTIR
jgi:hypothetical protein